jgi:alkylation response protein AidB-like acyl-CoA dehydrogenase
VGIKMDFELTEEQKDIQKAAGEFAQGEFDPDLAIELDQEGRFPESIWKKAAALGFIGIHYPEEFGGQGLGLFENLLVMETFCRFDSGIGGALSNFDLGSEILLKFGSHEQKRNLLTPLTKGERRLSVAFSESEDGKDLTSVSTLAETRNRSFIIHGRKRFVVNATLADAFIVLCQAERKGWVNLIVEREWSGMEVHPIEKMGLRTVPFGDLSLKEVLVPYERRIEGDGIAQAVYSHYVTGLRSLAQALGMIEGAFDRAVQYAKQREQFGKRLSQFQAIQHKLADMAVGMELARLLTYKSAIQFDHGETDQEFLSIARLEVGRKLLSVVDEALQIFGGYGYMAEQAIEHYYRDAWAVGAELGTEEELRDIIIGKMLGKPS